MTKKARGDSQTSRDATDEVPSFLKFLVWASTLSAFSTTPLWLAPLLPVAGFELYLFELPALLLAVSLSRTSVTSSRVASAFHLFTVAVMASAAIGIVSGAELSDVFRDLRPLLHVLLGFFIASRFPHSLVRSFIRCLLLLLWLSLALLIGAMSGAVEVSGRTETARLYSSSGASLATSGSDATRYLTPTTALAVLVAAACVCCVIVGNLSLRQVFPLAAPAVTISMLGFSRNHVLAMLVALLVALILRARRSEYMEFMGRIVVTTMMLAAATLLGALLLSGSQIGSYVSTQAEAYQSRVIGGLTGESRRVDSSAADRRVENSYMARTIRESIPIGVGLGYRYKPPTGEVGSFGRDYGQLYGHNFFLWILMKSGILGFIAIAGALTFALLTLLRQAETLEIRPVVIAVTLGSAAVISLVAPYPLGIPTAFLFGLLLGASRLLALPHRQREGVAL